MAAGFDTWAMFQKGDMGDGLEEMVETEDCKVLLDEAETAIREAMPAVSVDISALVQKFCSKDEVYILRQNSFIEHIFSELYSYIRNYKMNVAASILVTDRKKRIVDVAADVGYDNPSKFAAAFKGIFGMTPAEYRNDRR